MVTPGPKVEGYGNPRAKIVVVGEAPGSKEVSMGRPFVGPAGGVLKNAMRHVGIDPDHDVYFTNVCKYQPPGNDLSAWWKPGAPHDLILEGLEELRDELGRVNPNVIIPCGNYPLHALYSAAPSDIGEYRGSILTARRLAPGKKLVPTYHPSYILRGNFSQTHILQFDLARAKREASSPHVRGPADWVRPRRDLLLDPRGAERESARARLLDEGSYAVLDIEFVAGRLLCASLTSGADWAASFRIRSQQDLGWFLDLMRDLAASGKPLVMQNAMFDAGTIDWHYGLDLFPALKHDTMVAAYNLNIEVEKDLGFLTKWYTEQPCYWGPESGFTWKQVFTIMREDPWLIQPQNEVLMQNMLSYNAIDSWATANIHEQQQVELDSDPKLREAYEFDMRKMYPLWKMAKRGVRINHGKIDELRDSLDLKIMAGQKKLNAMCEALELPTLNVKSGPQVAKFLFDTLGVPRGGKTPGGEWKTDNMTLMNLLPKCTRDAQVNAIQTLISIRKARDLESKFTDVEWDEDGRSRCIYDGTKTTTRRLSSKKFFPTGKGSNLQNIPTNKEIRDVFEADEGMEFGYADLKAAEMLVVAELTQDREMLRLADMTIKGTGDVHCETAAYIYHIPASEVTKDDPRRYNGKMTRHSGNYGIGPVTLTKRINAKANETGIFVSVAEIKVAHTGYHNLHPGLKQWYREIESELRQSHTLRNLFGFKRVFLDISNAPEAYAFIPQSSIGDCLNFGLVNCDEDPVLQSLGFQLLLQVHDAIGYQYPKANRYAVNARIRQLMTIPMRVPKTGKSLVIPVEIMVGPTWGTVKLWEEDLKEAA